MKKFLGIDFGTKRIGLATANSVDKIAFPYMVIENNKNLLAEISKVIFNEEIDCIVIGDSRDYAGRPNKIMPKINKFIDELKSKTGLPVYLHLEFMSSAQAKHLQGENRMHDASAAAIILQSYLDQDQ